MYSYLIRRGLTSRESIEVSERRRLPWPCPVSTGLTAWLSQARPCAQSRPRHRRERRGGGNVASAPLFFALSEERRNPRRYTFSNFPPRKEPSSAPVPGYSLFQSKMNSGELLGSDSGDISAAGHRAGFPPPRCRYMICTFRAVLMDSTKGPS